MRDTLYFFKWLENEFYFTRILSNMKLNVQVIDQYLTSSQVSTSSIQYSLNYKSPIKVLQALYHALPLHLHQACVITLSKIKSKGRCISLSLNIINIDAYTCVDFGYFQCSVGNTSKCRQTRGMVHVFCKLSHSALYV